MSTISKYDPLRDDRIRKISYIVCKSETPLSSTQIVNETSGIDNFDKSSYIYKVIERLCPIWDFFPYPTRHKRNCNQCGKAIIIGIDNETGTWGPWDSYENGEKHNCNSSNKQKQQQQQQHQPIIRFLGCTTKEKPSRRALGAKAELGEVYDAYTNKKCSMEKLLLAEQKYFSDIRRDFRYYPNLRTLLLYLYNEYYCTTTKGRKARIHDVLSNPQMIKRAPFLEYWSDFKDCGFNIFNEFSDLLMNIGMEYRNQLDRETGSKIYLIKTITERIFYEVENHFWFYYDVMHGYSHFREQNGEENYRKLIETRNRYRVLLVGMQQGWLEEKRKELDFYEQECESFDLESIN